MSDELSRATEAYFDAAVAQLRAALAEQEARALWLAAEFDCGPDASEGKAAMRKVAHGQADARAAAAARALHEAHETWRRLGGTATEAETDAWLRRVSAAASR